jgi:hypothetical protein
MGLPRRERVKGLVNTRFELSIDRLFVRRELFPIGQQVQFTRSFFVVPTRFIEGERSGGYRQKLVEGPVVRCGIIDDRLEIHRLSFHLFMGTEVLFQTGQLFCL